MSNTTSHDGVPSVGKKRKRKVLMDEKKLSLSEKEESAPKNNSMDEKKLSLAKEKESAPKKYPKRPQKIKDSPAKSKTPHVKKNFPSKRKESTLKNPKKPKLQSKAEEKKGDQQNLKLPRLRKNTKPKEQSVVRRKKKIEKDEKHCGNDDRNCTDGEGHSRLGWEDLPNDLIFYILSKLGSKSVLAASLVCKSWRETALSDFLWSQFYVKRFGELPSEKPTKMGSSGLSKRQRDVKAPWVEAFLQRVRMGKCARICSICGKAFSDRGALFAHKEFHARRFRCDVTGCGKDYGAKYRLIRHFEVEANSPKSCEEHRKKLQFSCHNCGKCFFREFHFQAHVNKCHIK